MARLRPWLLGAVLCACTSRSSERVIVGYANESPFAFMDAAGKFTGEGPEIARRVLATMGMREVVGSLTEFGSLVPGLNARRFDLVAAGMYITPERCRVVAFSEPTYCIGESLLVREGNPHGLHGYEDIARTARVRVGVVRGAAQHAALEAAGIEAARIVVFADAPSAIAALISERVEAFAATALTTRDLLKKAGPASGVVLAEPFTARDAQGNVIRNCGAFAFRRDDTEVRDRFNQQLARFLGTEEHLALVAPFGFSAEELPPEGVTTARLCGR